MLGIAIRIAQRMGIHSEAALAKCESLLEAEMRRRLVSDAGFPFLADRGLFSSCPTYPIGCESWNDANSAVVEWWSLVLLDTRIGEMVDIKAGTALNPLWDCRIPLNLSDFDLADLKELPTSIQGRPTEAIFAVVRAALGDHVRHSAFYLETTCPAMKPVAKAARPSQMPENGGSEVDVLEKTIEEKYLQFCDPEHGVHHATIWFARGYFAKCRLIEHYVRYFTAPRPGRQSDAQRSIATSYALRMLECDTNLVNTPLTKSFTWMAQLYFPFAAYFQIAQDLRTRPLDEGAERAWETLSDNYDARFLSSNFDPNFTGHSRMDKGGIFRQSWFKLFAEVILRAWNAREAALAQSGELIMPPRIV